MGRHVPNTPRCARRVDQAVSEWTDNLQLREVQIANDVFSARARSVLDGNFLRSAPYGVHTFSLGHLLELLVLAE